MCAGLSELTVVHRASFFFQLLTYLPYRGKDCNNNKTKLVHDCGFSSVFLCDLCIYLSAFVIYAYIYLSSSVIYACIY